MDSFDHYNSATQQLGKYTNTTSMTIGTSFGRNGTNGLNLNSNLDVLMKQFTASSTLIVGFVFKAASPASKLLVGFRDAGTNQMEIRTDSSGRFQVTRNGTVLGTGTTIALANVFYHLQFKVFIADSGGTYEIKVNGITEVSGTGDTKNTANASANQVIISGGNSSFDDFWICNNSGSANNDFLGDVRIVARMPNMNGIHSAWTPVGAASNFQCVDDANPNDDTDYVTTSTASVKDTYKITPVGLIGPVKGIQIMNRLRKDDAGSRTVRRLIVVDGNSYFGSSVSLSDSWTISSTELIENNPLTGLPWTISEINNTDFGLELVS